MLKAVQEGAVTNKLPVVTVDILCYAVFITVEVSAL